MTTRICPVCGSTFVPKRQCKGVTCSRRCSGLYSAQQKYPGCRVRERRITCAGCGRVVVRKVRKSRDAGKYCSRQCAFKHDPYYNKPKPVVLPKQPIACEVCGRLQHKKRCSRECELEAGRRWHLSHRKPKPARACVRCGTVFTPPIGSKVRKFCSQVCGRRHGQRNSPRSHTSRARKFGVERCYSVTAVKVFDRDKWRCQLCGRATPKRLKGTIDPRAPELDHIVPLSKGGGHVWANVQCVCRRCNGMKSDTPRGQMRLDWYPRRSQPETAGASQG